jgi:hypothetical protein
MTDAITHPLEPLTPLEVQLAVTLLRQQGKVTRDTRDGWEPGRLLELWTSVADIEVRFCPHPAAGALCRAGQASGPPSAGAGGAPGLLSAGLGGASVPRSLSRSRAARSR